MIHVKELLPLNDDMRRAARKYAQHNVTDPFAYDRAISRMQNEITIPDDYLESHDFHIE